jgi:hypothetical protein
MGMLNVRLDDELERKLRLEVVRRFGGKKGALRQAVQEAIKLWLETSKK